jgi:hypothetical protein
MSKAKLLVVCAVFVLLVSAGWQLGACELANYELEDDLKDLAALNSTRIGLVSPRSDDDLREAVISRAKEHAIAIEPSQVTVWRSGSAVYLAVDYKAHIALPGCTLNLRFRPAGGSRR